MNDKVKVSVTLKDANSRPINNQKVSIKIGTKTYTVKTNRAGKASLNYKVASKSVLGKNITATYEVIPGMLRPLLVKLYFLMNRLIIQNR